VKFLFMHIMYFDRVDRSKIASDSPGKTQECLLHFIQRTHKLQTWLRPKHFLSFPQAVGFPSPGARPNPLWLLVGLLFCLPTLKLGYTHKGTALDMCDTRSATTRCATQTSSVSILSTDSEMTCEAVS
jgi:hypothetical protein